MTIEGQYTGPTGPLPQHYAVCEACGRLGPGAFGTQTGANVDAVCKVRRWRWAWATSGTGGVICPVCLDAQPRRRALQESDIGRCGVRSACRCPQPCSPSPSPYRREEVIAKVVEWIQENCEHRKSLDPHCSSYSWKHRAEWSGSEARAEYVGHAVVRVRGIGQYVSNSEFMVAAMRAGYRVVQEDPDDINALLDMALKRPVAPPKTFTAWLWRQAKRDDAVGDLARDSKLDQRWPRTANTLLAFQEHLARAGACEGARRTLDKAWAKWTTTGGAR
jgi:hypothetical protein